jgi:hypothetical protein
LLAGNAGWNPTGWMSVSRECCDFVWYRSLRRADLSLRGVLPIEVCLIVIEELHREGVGPLGLLSQEKKKSDFFSMLKNVKKILMNTLQTFQTFLTT